MGDDFSTCRSRMRACLVEQITHHAAVEAIEAAELGRVEADREAHPRGHPLGYEMKTALAGHIGYELAAARRESARRRAVMWGIAALVEAMALIVEDPYVET